MMIGGTSLTNFAGVVSRTFFGKRDADHIADTEFDKYERAPARRGDIEAMLSKDLEGADVTSKTAAPAMTLRASEKREHDTMSEIRGALYPAD